MRIANLKFLFLNWGALCVAVILLAGNAIAASWQWIDGQRVLARLNEGNGLWLIDVRSASAYDEVHVEGSVSIPADTLAHKKFSPQKTLILVDDSLGQKAAREAADELVKRGQGRVSVLEGGIAGWKAEGLPLVEKKTSLRGVNADEVKWALVHAVPFKLYDLRDGKDRQRAPMKNSEAVAGKTIEDRIEKLKHALSGSEKRKDLASRISKKQQIVLVFSASADAAGYTQRILQVARNDVRYLIGGYEAMVSERTPGQHTAGSCPTCPVQGK
jgi:rhodanese-related sulfurtransferase